MDYLQVTVQNDDVREVKQKASKRKGRGFVSTDDASSVIDIEDEFESLELELEDGSSIRVPLEPTNAQKSIGGWVIMIRGIHEESHEDDIYEPFANFGKVKNIHLNMDRRTGFIKGYALVEFEFFEEAEAAIFGLNGKNILGNTISVDWAFVRKPKTKTRR